MTTYHVENSEGMRWIRANLSDDTVRAAKGAFNYMSGKIQMDSPWPRFRDLLVWAISSDSPWRPRFRGTGELFLEPTLGGYHVLELDGTERWIFNNGIYWASDGDVRLSIYRERMWTSFWLGEGMLWYHTSAFGRGKVIIRTGGPAQERVLNNEQLVIAGDYVLARTDGIKFKVRWAERSLFSHLLSGERAAHVYEGTGRLLLAPNPYWRIAIRSNKLYGDPFLDD
jgi:uncharacterized protein (AIM24 family)